MNTEPLKLAGDRQRLQPVAKKGHKHFAFFFPELSAPSWAILEVSHKDFNQCGLKHCEQYQSQLH